MIVAVPLNFRPDAFEGTAEYYARFRPPYPRGLLDDLLKRAGVARSDRLLDLASGPGRVALELAASFREVIATDLEREMITQGEVESARLGIANISWRVGAAEHLDFAPASFSLVTIGDAFHRIDQPLVARRVLDWLEPGGAFAVIGSRIFFDGNTELERAVSSTVHKWAGTPANNRSGGQVTHEEGLAEGLSLLRDVGFTEVANYDFTAPHIWTAESLIGYHFSTSFASRRALGANADAFAADMRAALGHLGEDAFRQELSFGYTFCRKRG